MERKFGIMKWILVCLLITNTCYMKKHHDKPVISDAVLMKDKISAGICLSSGTDRLVYRFKNDTMIFIGFDVLDTSIVYSTSWKLVQETLLDDNNNRKQGGVFDTFPADEIRSWLTTDHLLAATNQKQQDDFERNLLLCSSQSTISLTCVIESFAPLARKLQEVDVSRTC